MRTSWVRSLGSGVLGIVAAVLVAGPGTAWADKALPPRFDGEEIIPLQLTGLGVAQISSYQGAIRGFLLLDPQFTQKAEEPPAGVAVRAPDEKLAEGPLDVVSTWDKEAFPFQIQFEDLRGAPTIERTLKLDPAHPTVKADFWSLFVRDPVFTVVDRTPTTVRLVWPDPSTDRSTFFVERTWTMVDDYRLESQVRLVNLGPEEVGGRLRLLVTGWESPGTGATGTCGGSFFGAAPDVKQAVCMIGDSLETKDRATLIGAPNFDVGGQVRFAGVNTRYFLVAAVPGPGIPTQCLAAGSVEGMVVATIQWGDADGKPFNVRPGKDACLPDYVLPIGDFAGRPSCTSAAMTLGLKGTEDFQAIEKAAAAAGGGDEIQRAKAALLSRKVRTFEYQAFLGPKDFDALKAANADLDDTIDFWVLGILAKPMLWLMRGSYSIIPSWGLAIIVLTLVVKLLTLYWTQKSMVQMKRMSALKPKMDALREKYKDDKLKLNQAMMDLYKSEKVNPMGGCLPMLLQMPIWIALYRTIYGAVDLYQAPLFLWIQDLSAHDPWFVLPLLLGGLMWLQQKMTPVAGDPAQAQIMLYMMPVMFTAMMLFLPSGLVFYILVNTLLSIGHQFLINRPRKVPARAG